MKKHPVWTFFIILTILWTWWRFGHDSFMSTFKSAKQFIGFAVDSTKDSRGKLKELKHDVDDWRK